MFFGNKNIDVKQVKAAKKYISNNLKDQREIKKVTNNFIYNLKNKYTGDFQFTRTTESFNVNIFSYDNNFDYFDDNGNFIDDSICNIKCKDGKVDFLEDSKKIKAFFKSKMVCGLHAALSFLNLGWSIYNLSKTYKGYEEVKNYNQRLEEIVARFNIHKNEIGILPDDLQEATERIKNVLGKIRKDQKELSDLIQDIRKSINFQESQKTKSFVGLALSGVLGVTGAIGGIVTCNATSFVYGASSIANIFSAIAHTSNIVMANDIIDQLNKTRDKACEEQKKIEEQIENLIKELTKRIQQDADPKFGLNTSSISSSSTKFDDISDFVSDFVIIDNYF